MIKELKINGIILTGLILLLATLSAFAVPSISEITGTPGDGNSLTITGSGFFNHPHSAGRQRPGWFTDFEDQNIAPLSSLSLATAFDSETANCMSVTSADKAEGTYSIRGDMSTECAAFSEAFIRFKSANGWGLPLSGTMVASVHRKNTSADLDENMKFWRLAEDDNDFYPNLWIGNAPSDGSQRYTEIGDLDNGTNQYFQQYFSYVKPSSTWMQDALFCLRESTNYGTNGRIVSMQDETVAMDKNGMSFNFTGQDTGALNYFVIEDDISNASTSGFSYMDFVYVDTISTCYVMFTDASTLGTSTKFWFQPYSAMETTEITITQKLADLGSNYDNVYVYACEWGDECSSGVQLSTAGEGGGGGSSSTPVGKVQMKGTIRAQGSVRL